jgi:NifU-like protein involved in Fe-S cluster formation
LQNSSSVANYSDKHTFLIQFSHHLSRLEKTGSKQRRINIGKVLLEPVGYSEKAIEYYVQKINVGIIDGVKTQVARIGCCGDSMEIYLQIEDGIINTAKFRAEGAYSYSPGSIITEMIKGKPVSEVYKISENDVLDELLVKKRTNRSNLPKTHARLAVEALKQALNCTETTNLAS